VSAVRSGPFTWSSFGAGYVVASVDDGGSPVIDVVLPAPSVPGPGDGGALRLAAVLQPDDAAEFARPIGGAGARCLDDATTRVIQHRGCKCHLGAPDLRMARDR